MKKNDLNLLLGSEVIGPSPPPISSVVYDSREAESGSAFVCLTGENQDGHAFIEQAIHKGAVFIAGTNKEIIHTYSSRYPSTSFMIVQDSRLALAKLSSHVYSMYDHPLYKVGVTGTNGKTTVTSFIYSLLNALQFQTGSIGTAGIWDDQEKTDFKQTVPTTPEAPELHKVMQHFRKKEMKAVVIESTSIAIEQKRLASINFDVAVHTNLTPEHLEFHGSMEAYKQAKLKLFDQSDRAVVNIDDPLMACDIIKNFKGHLVTYGSHEMADFQVTDVQSSIDGTSFVLHTSRGTFSIKAPVYGEYNVHNLLAAIAACHQLGFSIQTILSVLSAIKSPEGRFQRIENLAPYQIVLDYAHTPDALGNVLQAVKKIPHQRLIVMITGIGLRDPNKRPLMAEVVEGEADEVVVSVDQPGFANRQEVIDDVLQGFEDPLAPCIHSKLHREEAIHHALSLAQPDDIVLLTGIGFGGYQIIEDQKVPYSELNVIDHYFETKKTYKQTV
ncbi:UDP-N-acetylmuramoyl-L-alanyl-D-glutamate--2,6-diaminopimelate ligase [Halobacillus andaensis]|uniref:UDP-N-acetylmuramyl-tripeptide synthetase n=1 Tax=Halobacillus andaensis TaxID=1176239 RepID=A0A917EZM3_HALAA|nr:UDP-N-acetylmuramoyl-L-alanyl-D-glutamate--2,6-diaminopimelate ligase [Halobacillus andaensis]MBP2006307.1 UDP-N-acetylmuramoyl-L-alanyl-D-glutamate--2,6-diaminopimelate ligase [Halobacillus andaensis]GGF34145.1 UDP-N-acetylmuramoyl-L-alanyl-D-glutamate--2,6-diaminopimelate ligase [Halobacillus andaensis]